MRLDYLQKMIDLHTFTASSQMLRRRLRMSRNAVIAIGTYIRNLTVRNELAELQETVNHLQ